jgi:hypothetical protein
MNYNLYVNSAVILKPISRSLPNVMGFTKHMRQLSLYLGFFILGVAMASCSSSNLIQSLPQSKPIVVDGDASDWQLPLAFYDKETKLSFSVSNDSTKLYFCFEAFDQDLQTKIVRGGLQIYLDTNGGTSKDISMLYPIASTLPRTEPQGGASYGSSSDNFDPIGALRRNFYRSLHNELQLTGFLPPAAGLVPLKNAFGIEVSINWDTINNVLNYEAAIPFSTFYKRKLVAADSAKIIGLTFTVNGVGHGSGKRQKQPDETAGGDGNYPGAGGGVGGMGGGAGGMGGGGMGRGGGGGHRGGGSSGSASNPLGESQTLSVKLHLAKAS